MQWQQSQKHCTAGVVLVPHNCGRRTAAAAVAVLRSLTRAYKRKAAAASHGAQQSMQFLTISASCIVPSVCHHKHNLSFQRHYMVLFSRCLTSCQTDSVVGMPQVFEVDQAPTQDAPLSVEPVRKGRELSERINALIADLRRDRAVYPQCFVVRQGKSSTEWCLLLLCSAELMQFAYSAQRLYVWGIHMYVCMGCCMVGMVCKKCMLSTVPWEQQRHEAWQCMYYFLYTADCCRCVSHGCRCVCAYKRTNFPATMCTCTRINCKNFKLQQYNAGLVRYYTMSMLFAEL